VQFNHATTAGSLMQSIHILSYQSKLRDALLELGQRAMTGVGFSLRDQLAPPCVPFPHQLRISPEGGGGRQLFGIESGPSPVCFAKRLRRSAKSRRRSAQYATRASRSPPEITWLHPVQIKAGFCSFFVTTCAA
jgi:hypothetical protein